MAEVTTLGKVSGLCACFTKETLNGRNYNKIYQDILDGKNYAYNTMMERGGIFCELGHPAQQAADFERTDTAEDRACVLIQKITQKEKGKLFAEGVILDTPAGRIFKAIAPLYKFGFSSRGSYEADDYNSEGPNGWNQDSYIFKGFDLVALPANEESCVALESLSGGKKQTRRRAPSKEALDLNEIASATNVDKEEVEQELDKLFDDDGEVPETELVELNEEESKEDTEPTQEDTEPKEEAQVDLTPKNSHEITAEEVDALIKDLRIALKEKYDLAKVLENLTFEKSTNDAKVVSLTTQLAEKTEALRKLAVELDQVKSTASDTITELQSIYGKVTAEDDNTISSLTTAREALEQKVNSLQKESIKHKAILERYKQVDIKNKETYMSIKSKYNSAKEEITRLTKAQSATESLKASKETSLTQQLQGQKTALESVEDRLRQANNALISMTASMYDIDSKVLASRLTKSFTPGQLKSAAESLSRDAVRAVEFTQPILQGKIIGNTSDDLLLEDDGLIADLLQLD